MSSFHLHLIEPGLLEEPAESCLRHGKFVQILEDDAEYLFFACSARCRFHAQIVELVSGMRNWDFRLSQKGDDGNMLTRKVKVLGGGMWELDASSKTLDLHGKSQAYGNYVGIGLKDKIVESGVFAGFEISCREG